jgi:signal transduction histidine kinase
MKKDLYIKILIFFILNLLTYILWMSLVYYKSLEVNTSISEGLKSQSLDLYKFSQSIESWSNKDILDCAIIEESKSIFFNSVQKFDCKNLFFLKGFFYKINLDNNVTITYRILTKSFSRILLLISLFFINLIFFLMIQYFKKRNLSETIRIEKIEFKSELSRKMAHDIRSPLSTLSLLSTQIENPQIKQLQSSVIAQINQIASNILKIDKSLIKDEHNTELPSSISYYNLLLQIKLEFEIKITPTSNQIEFQIHPDLREISVFPPKFLYATINNLIQNAIDAIEKIDSARIKIRASLLNGPMVEIAISDNGHGIPKEVLQKLGKKEVTYGKNSISGNGIGILNASKDLASVNGLLMFESLELFGTTATIQIPVTLF